MLKKGTSCVAHLRLPAQASSDGRNLGWITCEHNIRTCSRAAARLLRDDPRSMYGNPSECCILAGSGGDHLTEEVCGLLGVPSTNCTHKKSDGGEFHIAINESIRGRDAHIIQSTCNPVNDNIIELSLIVSALRRASAERVIAVVPYYGYGRQNRKMRGREPIAASDVATIFENQGLDQIITIDLQHGQIAGFFSPRCSLDNLSVIPAVARFFWKRGLRDPVVRT